VFAAKVFGFLAGMATVILAFAVARGKSSARRKRSSLRKKKIAPQATVFPSVSSKKKQVKLTSAEK